MPRAPPPAKPFLRRGEGTSRFSRGGMADARDKYLSKHGSSAPRTEQRPDWAPPSAEVEDREELVPTSRRTVANGAAWMVGADDMEAADGPSAPLPAMGMHPALSTAEQLPAEDAPSPAAAAVAFSLAATASGTRSPLAATPPRALSRTGECQPGASPLPSSAAPSRLSAAAEDESLAEFEALEATVHQQAEAMIAAAGLTRADVDTAGCIGGGGGSGGSGAHDAAASTASGSDGTGFGGTSSGGMHCRRPAAPPPSIFELCAPPSACGDHKKNDDVGGGVGGGAGGFLGGGAGGGSGGGAGGGLGAAWASPAAKPAGLQTQGNGEVVIDLEVMSGAMAEQQQEYLPMGSAYLGERGRAIDTIQSTMAELGDIFQQLATMVQQQGERLQRVDDDLDDAQSNLRSGHAELQKYLRGLRSSRGLMIKIFIILFATIVLWGVLFA